MYHFPYACFMFLATRLCCSVIKCRVLIMNLIIIYDLVILQYRYHMLPWVRESIVSPHSDRTVTAFAWTDVGQTMKASVIMAGPI